MKLRALAVIAAALFCSPGAWASALNFCDVKNGTDGTTGVVQWKSFYQTPNNPYAPHSTYDVCGGGSHSNDGAIDLRVVALSLTCLNPSTGSALQASTVDSSKLFFYKSYNGGWTNGDCPMQCASTVYSFGNLQDGQIALDAATALPGSYRMRATDLYGVTLDSTIVYSPPTANLSQGRLYVQTTATGNPPVIGATVTVQHFNGTGWGSMTFTTDSAGYILLPKTFPKGVWGVYVSCVLNGATYSLGTSASPAYISLVPGPASSSNKYILRIANGGVNATLVADPANGDPTGATTPTGTTSGPGITDFTDMLKSLFIPSTSTIAQWSDLNDQLKGWGPIGWVSGWLTAFNLAGSTGGDPLTQPNLLVHVDFLGASSALDFRPPCAPGCTPTLEPPNSQGTFYGQMRAASRVITGYAVYAFAAFAAFKWLRPRLNV